MLVYKNARIPGQKIAEGTFKRVIGPLGVDHTNEEIERFDDIVNSIQVPLWKWDGNLADIHLPPSETLSPSTKDTAQRVRIWEKGTPTEGPHTLLNSKRIKLNLSDGQQSVSDADGPSLDEEAVFMSLLEAELQHPEYLPKAYISPSGTGNVHYMEYIPFEYRHQNPVDIANNLSKISSMTQELWLEHGIINHDIKRENLRTRRDGSHVIIDWGFFSWLKPGERTIQIAKIMVESPPYVDPTYVTKAYFQSAVAEIDIGKNLSYQLCCVGLEEVFGLKIILQVLKEKEAGFKWPCKVEANGSEEQLYSVCDATLYECWKQQPDRRLPLALVNTLSSGLKPRSRERINLNDMIQTLANVKPEDATVSYEEAILLYQKTIPSTASNT